MMLWYKSNTQTGNILLIIRARFECSTFTVKYQHYDWVKHLNTSSTTFVWCVWCHLVFVSSSCRRRTSWTRRMRGGRRRWRTCGPWWRSERRRETTWPNWWWSVLGTNQTLFSCASSELASLTLSDPTSSWRVSSSRLINLCISDFYFTLRSQKWFAFIRCPQTFSNSFSNWGRDLVCAPRLHESCPSLRQGGMCSLIGGLLKCFWVFRWTKTSIVSKWDSKCTSLVNPQCSPGNWLCRSGRGDEIKTWFWRVVWRSEDKNTMLMSCSCFCVR